MFAVIKSGAHQYKVAKGDTIIIDSIAGNPGDKIDFDQVLMAGDSEGKNIKIGTPVLSGSKVSAVIKTQDRADKIWVFKYKRRKNHKKSYGHKQPQTTVEIQNISV